MATRKTATRQGPAARKVDARTTSKPTQFPDGIEREEVVFRHYNRAENDHRELGLSDDQLIEMYRSMMLQRRFEERAAQAYGKQKISGFLHLYIGQEAVSTGTVFALTPEDYIITAYRDHGLGLALGMSTNACMAELYGKIDGCSRGKGGSMHFFDAEKHFMGGHGIVGGQVPVGVGISFAQKYQETGNVCVTFFGDGAIQQGSFHEAANLAGLYDLPAILVCENNLYGMGTAVDRSSANTDLYKRALGYDMEGVLVNGMDVFEVYRAMKDVAELARKGKASLVEVRTYRYRGHSMSDPAKYRTKEELQERRDRDPILRLKGYILEHNLASADDLDHIDVKVKDEVATSIKFAEKSPYPPIKSIYEDIYAQDDYPFLTD